MNDYRMFGISLRSEIPLTFPEQFVETPDITLRLESAGWFEQSRARDVRKVRAGDWYEHVAYQDGADYLRWPGLFEFLVSPDGRSVACRALEQSSPESFQTYLLGQTLSFALIKLGYEPLHATAVVIDGAAVALLGVSGQGKSTLAAAFISAGCQVLTDDLLILRDLGGELCGFPGPPRIKLFPEAAQRFLPAESALAPMNPDSNKFVIALPPNASHAGPAPVHAFFVLDGSEDGNLEISSLTGVSACMALLGASFNKRLVDPARLRRQFLAARDWAGRIPVKRLGYPWRLDRIEDVVQAVVADVNLARESVV